MARHLRHVLVLEGEAVSAKGRRAPLLFELGDHGLAAAGIAGHGVHGDRPIRRHDPRPHQGTHQTDEAGRVAAGIGHARGPRHGRALVLVHLGEAVGPARCDAIGGRGVDHLHGRIFDQTDGLPRRIIWQAQDHRIGRIQRLVPRLHVASPIAQQDQLQIPPRLQPLADLQSRGAGLAVDEEGVGHAFRLGRICGQKKGASGDPRSALFVLACRACDRT